MDQDNVFSKPSGEFDAPNPNPYAATQQNLSFNTPEKNTELADRGTRFAAVLLDGLIAFVLIAVLGIIAAIFTPFIGKTNGTVILAVVGSIAGIAIIGFAVMQLVLIARYGQTLGKRIMKIRVVRTGTDEKCGLGRYFWLRSFVTGLLGAIPLIGVFISLIDPLMIFSNDRRCLHDHIADTEVVKA